ncbi:MAG: PAS domain S-box protein [Gammaproteobacteria bacterium]|nr:PAS domain S-box protein [Gammaproteobacteria bacterium]MBT4493600.1 PAS domain S-box protein [Gammaproteobacteria bacterium]
MKDKDGTEAEERELQTERASKREELRTSREMFASAFNVSKDACVISNLETGKVIDVNLAWLSAQGWTREEVVGKTSASMNIWESESDRKRFYEAIERQDQLKDFELNFLTKSGEARSYLVDTTLVKTSEGTYLFTSSTDITERERAEQELRTSRELFANAFNLSDDLCSIADTTTGKILDVNPAFLSTFGFSKNEIIGKSGHDLKLWADTKDRDALFENVSIGNPAKRKRTRFLTKTGDVRTFLIDFAVIELSGEPKIFTLATDVTDKEKMEQELLKVAKLESISILAGGIAHDLNNMLTGILGNLSLARLSEEVETRNNFLNEIERASLGLKDLTLQLLTFSRGGHPVLESVDLNELLRKSVPFALHGTSITSQFNIPPDLQPVSIDTGQINQVINNLVINAQQAMSGTGRISITAKNAEITPDTDSPLAPGSYVQVSFIDHGVGIPEEVQQKIFDPFFTTKNTGSGLGLATTYSILQKHGGHINVTSQPGEGSTFEFFLPAAKKESSIQVIRNDRDLIRGEGKILVMDDLEPIRNLAKAILEKLGFETVTCIDGEEAIEQYRAALDSGRPFKAVFLDLTVPGGMGGGEAIQHLQSLDPQVKAIVASGYSDDKMMADFKDYGFSGSLAKPYRIEEMSQVLKRVINET